MTPEMYGLNLKDKPVSMHLDIAYIKYRGYNDDGELAEIKFDFFKESGDYPKYIYDGVYEDFCSDTDEQDKFSYTDAENNTYEYFDNGAGIFIFKNQELIGAATTSKVLLRDL